MANGSLNIETSNRYVSGTLSWSSTNNATNNTSIITATLRLSRTNTGYETYGSGYFTLAIGETEKTENGVYSFTYNSNTLCIKNTVTVPHNADGTKAVMIKVSGFVSSGSPSLNIAQQSISAVLDDNPRGSDFSVSDGVFGKSQSITIIAANSDFLYTFEYSCAGVSNVLFSKTASKTLTFELPVSIVNNIPNSLYARCTFKLSTYSKEKLIGIKTKEVNIFVPDTAEFYPSIESVVATLVSDYPQFSFVQNKSRVNISIKNECGAYSSTISAYSVSGHNLSSPTKQATSSIITKSGELIYTAFVRDSRGRESTKIVAINVESYFPPKIVSANAVRCLENGLESNEGTYAKVLAEFSYSSLNLQNTLSANIAYLETTENIESLTAKVIGVFSVENSYFIKVEINDSLGEADSYTISLQTAVAIINVNSSGNAIGFGKYCEKSEAVEFGWGAHFSGEANFSKDVYFNENVYFTKPIPMVQFYKTTGSRTFENTCAVLNEVMAEIPNGSFARIHVNANGARHYLDLHKTDPGYSLAYNDSYQLSGNFPIRFTLYAGVWIEEYVNPPCQIGTEYRTTQRWRGLPVYTKLIDCGGVRSGRKTVSINIGASQIIKYSGQYKTAGATAWGVPFSSPASFPTYFIDLGVQQSTIYIDAGSGFGLEDVGELYVQLYYTKQ